MTVVNARPVVPWVRDRIVETIDWRPPAGVKLISTDDHILEPPCLWESRIPNVEGVPKIWDDEIGIRRIAIDGRTLDVFGLNPENMEGRPGFRELSSRLKDMDSEGISAAVLYPQKAFALFSLKDSAMAFRCIDIYNEWLADFCKKSNGRLFGVAFLPTIWKPEATKDYLQKVRELGLISVLLPSRIKNVDLTSEEMDAVWSAVEAAEMPLSFHVSEFTSVRGRGGHGAFLAATFQSFPDLYAKLVFGGVLDRHPELNVVFAEGGLGWIPVALQNADTAYLRYESDMNPRLSHLPSYYWHRQCYATFQEDPVGLMHIRDIGIERAMWASDYPHPEGSFGHSQSVVRNLFEKLGDCDATKVVNGNARRLYKIN